ncbi:LysR family transcriptional regulator [Sphingomonadales bacterium 56]|uniref:LysR family transcriptional regulator n=1 Tax=unclassified Sphingobium TaxID=2611147 RepID=UPI00191B5F72|nr:MULTISPECIES: LysR family transcriptional regulator [unclassified Sphingobium]MBY2930156.1 LysR family transcriptional regulator [Sphingomonadales bacterium 56]MBY2959959.1 LysR family transcriptional regulator [Sphingomonadales bacterium 58]CAD7340028.1 HTH-type transcriptional regulator DmlR [Sphingobium sp. S8]CAD7340828.1 HTH-type transcriptional regulator DmlR [Sphingobium sp. S6]
MDPDYLLFARAVEAGSLSAAGRMLNISPAMMSKRLSRLEARLGVRLIHRTTRRLALTEEGASLHGDLVAILDAIAQAEERVTNRHRAASGPLRISAPTSFGRLHVAPHVGRFLEQHPRVDLQLNLSDAYEDLLAERIDLAIRITSDIPAHLEGHHLAANRRILCASPAYLAAHGTPERIADLSRHLLLAAEGQLPWRLVNGRARKLIDGQSHVRTNSSEIVRELALTGVGIALRSLWDVGDLIADGRLVRVLEPWEGPADLAVHAVHPRAAGRPAAVDTFIAFLRESFRDAPWNRGG